MPQYYVYSPLRGRPIRIHDSLKSATQEAGRLTIKEGINFQILQIVAITKPSYQIELLPEDD